MADMEVDEPIVERDEEDVEGDEVEGLDVGEADDAVKFVEDEEFNSRTVDADVAWLLKVGNLRPQVDARNATDHVPFRRPLDTQ
jgi:hypothetical protein